ncbi:MAG: twin-arginine translocase subunit TatC [Acidobacteriota bacterium]|nr:MAG: twin-arginine translocase subunit TatC [Acidobacteriota bacterium]
MNDPKNPQSESASDSEESPQQQTSEDVEPPEESPETGDSAPKHTVPQQSSPSHDEPIEPTPPPDENDPEDEAEEGEEEEGERGLGGRMTFLEHLDEFRRRILNSVVSILVTFVAAWIFREEIYNFIAAPIYNVVEKLVVIKPTEPFTIYLKTSFAVAIFLASPFILLQVWLFIAPGLYRKEKGYALPFLFSSTLLFVLGGMFAYYVVLPPALDFLLLEFGKNFQALITAIEYFDFALLIIIGMGVVFQLPVLVAFLSIFGMITPRFLWKNFRYAFLLITIIAAVVSPTTDPFNLFLWSGPMVVLYTISIAVSWVFKRRRDKDEEADSDSSHSA